MPVRGYEKLLRVQGLKNELARIIHDGMSLGR